MSNSTSYVPTAHFGTSAPTAQYADAPATMDIGMIGASRRKDGCGSPRMRRIRRNKSAENVGENGKRGSEEDAKMLEDMGIVVRACSKAVVSIGERHDKKTVPKLDALKKEVKELKVKMGRMEGILDALLSLGTLAHGVET